MLIRVLTGIVALLVFIPFLIFADSVSFLFPLAMGGCALISCFELLRSIGQHKNYGLSIPVYLLAYAAPFTIRYVGGAKGLDRALTIILGGLLLFLLYSFALAVLSRGKRNVTDLCTATISSIYVIAGFSAIVFLFDFHEGGKYIYLLTFIGAWVTDTFAYFTGRFLGKHKLIPEVSPKKTVEGAIGGLVGNAIGGVVFAWIMNSFLDQNISYVMIAVLGVICSVVAQLGDLSFSLIKREFGIKDYGTLFLAHGGVLDRFDSVIFVAPVLSALMISFL